MSRYRDVSFALFALFAISACTPQSEQSAEGNVSTSSGGNPATDQLITTETLPTSEYKPITLNSLECGDNCYLELTEGTEGAAPRKVLCTASLCWDWRAEGRLPPPLRATRAEAKFGQASQVDGAGNVMARNVEAIVDLRVTDAAARPISTRAASLPLERGVYVLAGSDCGSPANAAFRIWNGTGLSGSATRACRTEVLSRDGRTYRVSNSCDNTYNGSRTADRFTVAVPDAGRFQIGDGEFRKCSAGSAPASLRALLEPSSGQESSPTSDAVVPARFRGLFAPDRRACEEDYTYNPAFQNVHVRATGVSFFETGGPVADVQVNGDNVAITLRETVGEGVFTRAIYLALNRDGSVRYRQDRSEPVRNFVRCEGR